MRRRGFTLVELMIVVAICGIMAAVAIPAFQRYIRRSKGMEVDKKYHFKLSDGRHVYCKWASQGTCGVELSECDGGSSYSCMNNVEEIK